MISSQTVKKHRKTVTEVRENFYVAVCACGEESEGCETAVIAARNLSLHIRGMAWDK